MKHTLHLLAFIFVCISLEPAQARYPDVESTSYGNDVGNIFIAPSLLYYTNLRSRNSKDYNSYLNYELKAGYQFWPNVFLGLSYQGDSDQTKNSGYASATLNNESKSQRSSYGPTVGYVTSTYHIMFTYYLASKWNLETTTNTGTASVTDEYDYSGNGFQLDVGYKIPFGSFLFGPQLSYKIFNYGKLSTNGGAESSISPKLKETALEPSIVLYYFF